MGMVTEFKEFAMRGNVMDLAIGVVIGTAFGKIVSSLVDKLIMPIIGWLTSGQDFSELAFNVGSKLGPDGTTIPAIAIGYGAFLQSILDFMIVAFVIFLVVKGINRLRKKDAATPGAPPAPTTQEKLLIEIRDLLAQRQNG